MSDASPIPETAAHEGPPKRRQILELVVALTSAAIATALGVPVLGYLLSPLVRRRDHAQEWVNLGPLSAIPDGRPVEVPYLTEVVDGWVRQKVSRRAIVVRGDAEAPTVFSSTCPHLNCNVRWADKERQFVCPCHGGVFDSGGEVLAGPPARGLDRLEVRIENGALLVREARP